MLILNCLTSNISLFNFNSLTSNFSFGKTCVLYAAYGRASLVSGFKFNRKNDDLLSSRYYYLYEHEYAKMQIPNKRYRTNTACTFRGTGDASAARYFGLDHFSRYDTKICGIQVKLWSKKFSVVGYVGELRIRSQQRVFPSRSSTVESRLYERARHPRRVTFGHKQAWSSVMR